MKTHILKPILIAIVCLLATPSFFGMDQHAAKRRRCEYFQNTCKLASLTRTLHRAAKQGDIELTRRCLASPLQPHPAAKANLIHKWQTPLHRAARSRQSARPSHAAPLPAGFPPSAVYRRRRFH